MHPKDTRQPDSLHRFIFEHIAVRGELVQLDRTWRTVLERRSYPAPVRQLLGEAVAATALLYATIKFRGRLTLQLQGEGPVHLLVVQCNDRGELRALARWHDLAAGTEPALLCAGGTMTVTVEPDQGQDRYQGIVQLDSGDVKGALERYFAQSEQLPTRFQLACTERGAAGLLLQRLPGAVESADDWTRIQQLGATVTAPELLTLDPASLLRRLFNEDTVRLFRPQPLSFRCSCSRARTAAMLKALGRDEVEDILAEQGAVTVSCEFCGLEQSFDAVDVAQLYEGGIGYRSSSTRH